MSIEGDARGARKISAFRAGCLTFKAVALMPFFSYIKIPVPQILRLKLCRRSPKT